VYLGRKPYCNEFPIVLRTWLSNNGGITRKYLTSLSSKESFNSPEPRSQQKKSINNPSTSLEEQKTV